MFFNNSELEEIFKWNKLVIGVYIRIYNGKVFFLYLNMIIKIFFMSNITYSNIKNFILN